MIDVTVSTVKEFSEARKLDKAGNGMIVRQSDGQILADSTDYWAGVEGAGTLEFHRARLRSDWFPAIERERLSISTNPHIKNAGFKLPKDMREEFVDLIMSTQDSRCLGWYDQQFNLSWNDPQEWWRLYCNYHVDHLNPVNNGGECCLENFVFSSANINRFIKCSMTIDRLLDTYKEFTTFTSRIEDVLERREVLFKSDKWLDFKERCEQYRC